MRNISRIYAMCTRLIQTARTLCWSNSLEVVLCLRHKNELNTKAVIFMFVDFIALVICRNQMLLISNWVSFLNFWGFPSNTDSFYFFSNYLGKEFNHLRLLMRVVCVSLFAVSFLLLDYLGEHSCVIVRENT